jgi:hypothetical protein
LTADDAADSERAKTTSTPSARPNSERKFILVVSARGFE